MPAEQPSLGIWAESAFTLQTWGEFPSQLPRSLLLSSLAILIAKGLASLLPTALLPYTLGSRLSLHLYPLFSLVFGCHHLVQPLYACYFIYLCSKIHFFSVLWDFGRGTR